MVSRIQVSFNSKRRDAFRYKIHRKVKSTARAMSFPVAKKPLTFKKQEITFQIQDPKNPCYPFTNSKFQSERGYRCKTKWDDAIVKTINFFKEISNPRDKATINQENFVTEIPSACLRLNQLLKIIQHHPNKKVLVLCMERGEAEIE